MEAAAEGSFEGAAEGSLEGVAEASLELLFVSKGNGDAVGIRPRGGASAGRAVPLKPPGNGAVLICGACGGGGRSSGSALDETGTGAWKVPMHRPEASQSIAPALRAEGDAGPGEPSALGLRFCSGDQVGAGEMVGPM